MGIRVGPPFDRRATSEVPFHNAQTANSQGFVAEQPRRRPLSGLMRMQSLALDNRLDQPEGLCLRRVDVPVRRRTPKNLIHRHT
jgi:hypothetical protein